MYNVQAGIMQSVYSIFIAIIITFISEPCFGQSDSIVIYSVKELRALDSTDLSKIEKSIKKEYMLSTNNIDKNEKNSGYEILHYLNSLVNRFIVTSLVMGNGVAFDQLMSDQRRIKYVANKLKHFHKLSFAIPYNLISQNLFHEGFAYYSSSFLKKTLLSDTTADSLDRKFIETLFNYAYESAAINNRNEQIHSLYRAALLAENAGHDTLRNLCLNSLATAYREVGEYIKSQKTYELLFTKITVKNTIDYAHSLQAYSNLITQMGDFEKAEELTEEAYDIIAKIALPGSYDDASVTSGLLLAYFNNQKYNKGKNLFINKTNMAREGFALYPEQYLVFLGNASSIYIGLGDFDKSIKLANQAMEIAKTLPESKKNHQIIGILNLLGKCYSHSSNPLNRKKSI